MSSVSERRRSGASRTRGRLLGIAVAMALLALLLFGIGVREAPAALVVPGTVLALAVVPLVLRRHPAEQRWACYAGGVVVLAVGLVYLAFGGVLFLPTGTLLLLAGRRRADNVP